MSWIEVHATFPESTPDLSPFVEIYRDNGIENTLESSHSLTGCLVSNPEAQKVIDALVHDLRSAGATRVDVRDLPEENWDDLWRRHFKPRRVGRHLVIRPSWEEFDSNPNDLIITLDPGQAFGTGDHATTRMCLEMLESTRLEGLRVLDLGSGSGILSIAAKLLGADEVVAVDIDPVSVEVCRENASRNRVHFVATTGDGLEDLDGAFHVIVSNIISATLIRLAPEATRYLVPGGTWILSGVIVQNWNDVRASAEAASFLLESHREEDGWVAARFVKLTNEP